ncbi:unnamed protein product [Cylicocyclus nassatus]|uniref:G-protein coupled receptors family 1 profile domain-containing protein n=1 Tax=Cylicocyclus nassatus TaxID=53992 RepID=A0AA36GS14_CYLNA|nr:unnamed protein product [Cylicocyclus nassatus]
MRVSAIKSGGCWSHRAATHAGTWFVLSVYSLAANTLLIVLIFSSTELRRLTSYWILASFAVCEVFMSAIALCYVVPSVLLHEKLGTTDLTVLYHFLWNADVIQLALMALNRYVSIVYPIYYSTFFSKKNTARQLCICYILATLQSLPTLTPCCYILWDSYNYISYYISPDSWYKVLDLSINIAVLVEMVTFYTVVLCQVRRVQHQTRQSANEIIHRNGESSRLEVRLLAQFLAVSLIYLATWTTWQWMPFVSASKWLYFLMMSFAYLNNAVNPTIYLYFNNDLRSKVYELWSKNQNQSIVNITIRRQNQ